ncbi:molybdopterin-guanine dinucleotide biosynthesis protein A [Methylosinus sp. C49]|uniref:nucleotidyltransferase family protein n=1 Tax=Methylosinus sp. C49 TaxID=2699395 RepID=UPI001366D808|nr:nucleotidyltransferase family protein [Methylosinus sp. C49]BBU63295.1 molybdopterin-guanine dinucleotide biosynthesis protein A [Methylosinus sp. C49]
MTGLERRYDASSFAVLVLAAGRGSRFGGGDKLSAPLAGVPVAHHILSALRPFAFAQKLLVCRSRALWTDAFARDGFSILHNDDAEGGMLASLKIGATSVEDRLKLLVCLADMPFVATEHLALLLSAAAEARDRIVASIAGAYRGPPAVFPVDELLRLPPTGEGGARSLLANARFVDCDADRLLDIDTRQDLFAAQKRFCPT